MPKKYITSDNIDSSLNLIATNMTNSFSLKDWEVSSYLKRIFKGIIDDKTIIKHLPRNHKKAYRILKTCPKCGKKKIKDMKRHNQRSHKQIEVIVK